MKQTSEVRRLPISRGMRLGAVLFSTALLSAGFLMLDITWLNFGYSLACAAVLAALWLARYRLPDEWTGSAVDALSDLVWPLLGLLLWLLFASIYILLRAPEESSPVR